MESNFNFYYSQKEIKVYNKIYETLIKCKILLTKENCLIFMQERANI